MNITTEQLFDNAGTHNVWTDKPVSEAELRELWRLTSLGPTSANTSPLRAVFVRSADAKARLVPCMDAGNQAKVAAAPVTAILGMDLAFYEHMGKLFPHNPGARSWFEGNQPKIESTAFRNSSLQGGYFILAARALGLDCGPMSGFDAEKVDALFWAGTKVKTNFICSLGHGDGSKLFPRSPRFGFEEACKTL